MILVCDECQSRYLVPDHAIGSEGRRVRCKSCDHEWFQKPDKEEEAPPLEDDRPEQEEQQDQQDQEDLRIDDIEPLPESLRRRAPDEGAVLAISGKNKAGFDRGKYAGYAVAALVFLVIMGGILLMHTRIVTLWPASVGFYDLVGMETVIDGENLVFDQLSAVSDRSEKNVNTLIVKGKILNLERKDSRLPLIQASLLAEDGKIVDRWLIEPEKKRIKSEGEQSFHTAYPQILKNVKEVNIRFIVGSKIKVKKPEKEEAEPISHEETPKSSSQSQSH